MKVVGFWSGHDCSFCVLNEGVPELHVEYERHLRLKEPKGDSVKLYLDMYGHNPEEVAAFTTCPPEMYFQNFPESYEQFNNFSTPIHIVGHHTSHAANAFYSSNFEEALIMTFDGGGSEFATRLSTHGFNNPDEDSRLFESAHTVFLGRGKNMARLLIDSSQVQNYGGVWTRTTRYIFRLSSGYPTGHQAGTVMAMSAFGDPEKYKFDFLRMFNEDLIEATKKPTGQVDGRPLPNDPVHPYLDRWEKIANRSVQERYDLAAGLQAATEICLRKLIKSYLQEVPHIKKLCLSGGVVLNSVMTAKLYDWFPQIEEIYIPPAPYDAGLCVGSAQYVWHQLMDKPRVNWKSCPSPYLGLKYSKESVVQQLSSFTDKIKWETCADDHVVDLLAKQNIISIFSGRAETGRRALGNRSIIADPRSHEMKDKVNLKVKHRQSFRPFAPSVLREHVSEWFERDVESPYMSFVLKFKENKRGLCPAVEHKDFTARLQTVSENDNPWYYGFLKKWHEKSGVPMVLNTSFNDTSPICDSPEDSVKCFLGTEIDYLYFPEHQILVSKT